MIDSIEFTAFLLHYALWADNTNAANSLSKRRFLWLRGRATPETDN